MKRKKIIRIVLVCSMLLGGLLLPTSILTAEAFETDDSSYKNIEVSEAEKLPFYDVEEGDWYYNAVKYANEIYIMKGLDGTHFGPTRNIARAQFAVILYCMNGEPLMSYQDIFPDVEWGMWYTDAVLWAADLGVVTGYSDSGYFGPADNITREQMAVMLFRYAKIKGYDTTPRMDIRKYSDESSVNDFAWEAVNWCVAEGIITGKDNGTRLDPQGYALRAECAAIMQRFLGKYADADPELERKYSSEEIMEMYSRLGDYEGKWKDFGNDEYQNMVKTAIDATVPFYWYFGDIDSIDIMIDLLVDNEDIMMNGANAKNHALLVRLAGESSGNGDMVLDYILYSPDGVHLVCE